MQFFEMGPIQDRAKKLGMDHLWHPITDFDKKDLRVQLPKAVKAMNEHVAASPGVVYVHCTGGMHLHYYSTSPAANGGALKMCTDHA